MGLAAINDWSTQNPFIDLMKQSRAWHNWAGGSNQFVLDKNDWPLSLAPQQEAGKQKLGQAHVYWCIKLDEVFEQFVQVGIAPEYGG